MFKKIKKINEYLEYTKTISESGMDVYKGLTPEEANQSCKQLKKSIISISLILLLISIGIFQIWKIPGMIILSLSVIYTVGGSVYYPRFKRDLYSKIENKKTT